MQAWPLFAQFQQNPYSKAALMQKVTLNKQNQLSGSTSAKLPETTPYNKTTLQVGRQGKAILYSIEESQMRRESSTDICAVYSNWTDSAQWGEKGHQKLQCSRGFTLMEGGSGSVFGTGSGGGDTGGGGGDGSASYAPGESRQTEIMR